MLQFHTSDQRLKQCYITDVPQFALVYNVTAILMVDQNTHTIPTGIHHQQHNNKLTKTLECNYYCCNCTALLDLQYIVGFNMVFCNCAALMKLYCI